MKNLRKDLLAKIGEAGHAPLCRVNYSSEIDDLEIVKELADFIESDNDSSSAQEIFNNLISSSPLFKHPSFISEKEYRLVSLPYNVSEYLGDPHFFVEETNIKKYYILKLRDVCEKLNINYVDLFNEVCIGPQARVTKTVLADYFYSTGMKDLCSKIKISECPLRRF